MYLSWNWYIHYVYLRRNLHIHYVQMRPSYPKWSLNTWVWQKTILSPFFTPSLREVIKKNWKNAVRLTAWVQPSGIGYLRVGSSAAPIIADFGKRRNCANTSSVLDLVQKEIRPRWKYIFTWTQYQGLLQSGGQGLGRQDGRMGRCKIGRGNTEKMSSLLQYFEQERKRGFWKIFTQYTI